eukprot:COSAG01_NODE_8157_length_2898_cov_1.780993_2_plen_414_part_00
MRSEDLLGHDDLAQAEQPELAVAALRTHTTRAPSPMPRQQEFGLPGSVNGEQVVMAVPAKGQQGFCHALRRRGVEVALLGVLVGCGIGAGVTLAVRGLGHTSAGVCQSPVASWPRGVCQILVAEHAAGHSTAGYIGASLSAAIAFLQPRGDGAAAVCPLADMQSSEGDATVRSTQMLAIGGAPTSLMPTAPPHDDGTTPRLWARFDVSGTLLLTGVTICDQAISPGSTSDPQGAAAQVRSGGRLVATAVSFLRLVSTGQGGAVHVDGGGVAEFYGCLFDSCHATTGCVAPYGQGGAIFFDSSAAGIIADSAFRSNHVGCSGGALYLLQDAVPLARVYTNLLHPFAANVTISRTAFADNHVDNHVGHGFGGDIRIYYYNNNQGAVPCPPPGKLQLPGCSFDGDYESLTVTLPSS